MSAGNFVAVKMPIQKPHGFELAPGLLNQIAFKRTEDKLQ